MNRLLAASALALFAACSSPSRVQLGELVIENRTDRPVAFVALWEDDAGGGRVLLEGLVPGTGHGIHIGQEADIPVGVELRFAASGAGFEALLERNGLSVVSILQSLHAELPEAQRRGSAALLRRSAGTLPRGAGPLEPYDALWVRGEGAAYLRLVTDEAGRLRVEEG